MRAKNIRYFADVKLSSTRFISEAVSTVGSGVSERGIEMKATFSGSPNVFLNRKVSAE